MQKKLFTQIRNEWCSNLWLMLELLVVSVVLWFIIDLLYCRIATYLEPRGFDISHCYLLTMGELTDKSPDYHAYTDDAQRRDDIFELMDRLRHRPEVEAVSLSINSYPYNGSNSSVSIQYGDSLDSDKADVFMVRRHVTPDFVRVFRYQGTRGETPEQLADILRRGEVLASDNCFETQGVRLTDLVGKVITRDGDSTKTMRLGAALKPVRYMDYEQASESYSLCRNLEEMTRSHPGDITADLELCLRVREGMDNDFISRLMADSEAQYRVGNIYLADVRSFADVRRNFQRLWTNQMRDYAVGLGFLMLNIFLGLLGTFWFRTQQRRSEIALHKVNGATNGAVFSRLICEGLGLLVLVTPLALLIDWIIAANELNAWRNGTTLEADRLLLCAFMSFAFVALMIVIGICIPARKAMHLAPVEALHDE